MEAEFGLKGQVPEKTHACQINRVQVISVSLPAIAQPVVLCLAADASLGFRGV